MADQTFAVHCGFFDAINSDRTYSADEMNRPYRRVISNGVFATPSGTPSTDLQVTASSGMNIICKKGEGLFGDKWFENPSSIAITVPSNTGTVPRIDSVLVQVDTRTSGRVGNIVHRTGTPASSPTPPAINQTEGVVEYRLANIRVNAGVSAITQSMITDRRGSSDCPWVTSLIYQVDTSTLYDQWQAAYEEYFETEKAIWDAWYAQLTEDLDVSMTLDRHVNTVTTTAQTTGYIPIGLAYNHNTDILEVYINGLRAVEGTHYVVVDDTTILVENQLQIGQTVTFVVMRSVISGSATTIMVLLQELESQIAGIAGGTPTVVDAKADMTEHDKIYILSSDGKWYYYSATQSDWVVGGTYGGVPTDTTLTISGSAADAKAVGDAIDALDDRVTALESGTGLTADIKSALLACFAHVAWVDEDGQDYYDALDLALNPPANLVSISAVYTQSGTVYDTASLDDLKSDLVVTAHYSDSTSAVVTTYTLSGTLTEGTSTITVAYGGKTTTFNVTVTSHLILTHNWDFKTSLVDTVGEVTAVCNNCSLSSGTGIVFDGATDNVVLGDVFGFDKTLEIDYEDATATFGNVNGIIFWTNQAISSGFGYHHDSVSSKRRFGYFSSDVAHWAIASDYQKSSFDGSGTVKMTIDSQGIVTVYKDDVDINLLYDSAPPYYSTEENASYITLGSPNSNYPCFVGMTITGVRIYEGV